MPDSSFLKGLMVAFASVKIPATVTILQECGIVCGIICGSLLWWIVLSGVKIKNHIVKAPFFRGSSSKLTILKQFSNTR